MLEHTTGSCSDRGCSPTAVRSTTSPSLSGTRPGQRILGEGACQGLLAADFLAAHEALDSYSDGAVDVLARDVVRQSHATERFADADDSFQVTNLSRVLAGFREYMG